MTTLKYCTIVLLSCFGMSLTFAYEFNDCDISLLNQNKNVVAQKIEVEAKQDQNPFAIVAYEPNYLLPFNYSSPISKIYINNTPNNQKIKNIDVKFQFSFKAPIWRDFLGYKNVLYLAYTQQSFWQAYNDSPFFRANNYKPEIFLENDVNLPFFCGWNLQLLNIGAIHQSNGRGGELERSWNRFYLETVFSKDCWLVAIRPWFVLKESSIKKYNPNIERYLGHGRIVIAYKFGEQVVSLVTHNNLESRFHRGSVQINYSFPLVKKIKGYLQVFSGYRQNLVEYNHRTKSIGVGICLSDWL